MPRCRNCTAAGTNGAAAAAASPARARPPSATSVREMGGRAARSHQFHLEQLRERLRALQEARLLEERLLLERLEVEILRQRVDQILVRHRGRQLRVVTSRASRAALDNRA